MRGLTPACPVPVESKGGYARPGPGSGLFVPVLRVQGVTMDRGIFHKGRTGILALATVALVLGTLPGLSAASGPTLAAVKPAAVPQAVIPAVPGQLRVTAAGDYASTPEAAGVLSRIGTIKPDLHLALGDLSYGATGAEQSWCDFVTSRTGAGFPFQLIAGNHESNGLNGNINDFAACLPNQLPGVIGSYARQYYVDVPQQNPIARLVFISPGVPFTEATWDYSAGTARYNWTAAAIDGARAASIPWVVASMHMPCISIGQYGCAAGADITNLLLSKKVDLVLNGHEHMYQRSKQLSLAAGCTGITPGSYNPSCVRDSDNSLTKGAGTVISTVGTGGVTLRDVFPADSEAGYFAASSGLNSNPSHGIVDLQFTATSLTSRFVATQGAFTDEMSIVASGENAPPTASFTESCTALACNFNGSASSDPDGSIAAYSWNFGDGGTANTATPSHSYATAGTYTVTLTVTDNAGATAMAARQVSVGTASVLASDAFSRTVTNGFGSADVGGAWSTTGTTSAYAVSDGAGRIRIATAGSGNYVSMNGISSSATDLYLTLATDKPASGSGLYLSAIGRRVAGAGEYRAKVQLTGNGAVGLYLIRASSTGAETTIASGLTIAGLNYAVGDKLAVRLQVTGTGPTTIRAKVWELGTTEPTTWQRSVTDSTAGLQVPGGIGLTTYLSGSATNAPLTVLIDDLLATRTG